MEKIKAYIMGEIISSIDADAFSLYEKSHFGEPKDDKIQYSLTEALFLLEKGKIDIFSRDKKLSKKEFIEKCRRVDKKIQIKYLVFKDLRERGYVVKTALKFGADFRVYAKGSKPGVSHAKWIVFAEHESKRFTWHEFSAKNRVAHSTKKNLLLAIVDEEGDISYYEVRWIKP
ncbi:MAG: tRNA-intron lyase [Candidatus Nanoarchaeia archaeon]|nr:tRNA-intron lyase [Candidatus Nanoarchaeia archaeon]MDD5358032.1 tRNA-intron lyase [Candidatus Nanoarchaeia archaeon]MDD5588951.1 tRNA-intron lyase [Candidatus Nanoarchaeia archaeon]